MEELIRTAIHESGHGVATIAAFRDARWLPRAAPPLPVTSLEIAEPTPGQWVGCCNSLSIFSQSWPEKYRVNAPFLDMAQAQAVIHLGGSFAEAIHRGERRRQQVLDFAIAHCHADADLQLAAGVLTDLQSLGAYDEQRLVDMTLATLWANWDALEALAARLVEKRRLEGDEVLRIVDAV